MNPTRATASDSNIEWRSYLAGYESGIAYGVTAGYREALTDMFDVHAYLVASGLLRRPSHAEVLARRQASIDDAAPALTAEQIRARAAASWDLTPDAPPSVPRIAAGAVPCPTRGARRRMHQPGHPDTTGAKA